MQSKEANLNTGLNAEGMIHFCVVPSWISVRAAVLHQGQFPRGNFTLPRDSFRGQSSGRVCAPGIQCGRIVCAAPVRRRGPETKRYLAQNSAEVEEPVLELPLKSDLSTL